MGSRWKFAAIQLLRKFHGSVHVFCRPDRSADYSRVIGFRHGKGPALALLLAGPSLSLPNMLVIQGVMGTKKTIVYVALVIIMATISGFVFGNFF